MRTFFALTVILVVCCSSQLAVAQNRQSINADSAGVARTLNDFVDSFRNLEWEKFNSYFSEDATVFFPPSANYPERANNKREIDQVFGRVFANARKRKATPPYLDIEPMELKIQVIGPIAITTFMLNDPDMLGRRTIVLKKEGSVWRIVHLHASGAIHQK